MVKVKICGITNLEDALAAIECGADALGFVFAPSPRQVTIKQAEAIIPKLPWFICKVGVFVDAKLAEVISTMANCGLDLVQLHGSESAEYCESLFPRVIKSFRVKDKTILELLPHYKANAYLLDSYDANLRGGTGQTFNWEIAREAKRYGRIILSGGLNPDNVRQAIAQVQPYAVDVSSGVEISPGKKEHHKLRDFIRIAKQSGLEK